MLRLKSLIWYLVLLSLAFPLGNAWAKKPKFDEDSVSAITLDVVRVEACARGKGCIVAGGPMQVDLLDMAEDNIDYVKQVLLPERTRSLRLILGDNSTITVDGESFPLSVPRGKRLNLIGWKRAFPKEGGFLSNLELKFNLKRQIVVTRERDRSAWRNWKDQYKGKNWWKDWRDELKRMRNSYVYSYKLKPVIRVRSAAVEELPENMVAVVAVPDGETVLREGDDDLVVTIPAGAVDEPIVITARKIENAFYELNPEGYKFIEPVTIAMSYSALFSREAGYTDDDLVMLRNGIELPSSTDIDSQAITVSTKEFSLYGIFAKEAKELGEEYLLKFCNKRPTDDDFKSIISIMEDEDNLNWPFAASLMRHWFHWDDIDKGKIIYRPSPNPANDKLPDELVRFKLISDMFAYFKTKAENNELFNGKAVLDAIVKGLKETKQDGFNVIPHGGPFDHIKEELKSAGNIWNDGDWERDNMFYAVNKSIGSDFDVNQYTAAFGKGLVRAVASGKVIVTDDIAEITINKAGIYFKDSYDFTGRQPLGCWSTKSPYLAPTPGSFMVEIYPGYISLVTPPPYYTCVCNESFRNYNLRNGEKKDRGNFRIFSDPEEYTVKTNQVLTYQIPNNDLPPCTKSGLYCGSTDPSLKNNTRYECRDGVFRVYDVCANGCIERPDEVDLCDCPNGKGFYCAPFDSSLDYNTLYYCEDGIFSEPKKCAYGCEEMSKNENDRCKCPNGNGNGWYCGSVDSSLDYNRLYHCVDGVFIDNKVCTNGCIVNQDGYDDECNDTPLPYIDKVSPLTMTVGTTREFTITGKNLPKDLVGNIQGTASHCEHISGSGDTVILSCEAGTVGTKRFFLKEEKGGVGIAGSENIYIEVTEASLYFPKTDLYIPATGYANTSSIYATTENAFKGDLIGQCTWYAYGRVIELVDKGYLPSAAKSRFESAFWGTSGRHAKNWPSMLDGNWDKTVQDPLPMEKRKKGLLAVWVDSGYGHVGFVEEVNSDKTKYRLSDFNRGLDVKYRDKWYNFVGTSDLLLGTYPQFYDIANPNW